MNFKSTLILQNWFIRCGLYLLMDFKVYTSQAWVKLNIDE